MTILMMWLTWWLKIYKKTICFHRNEIKISRYLSSVHKVIKFEWYQVGSVGCAILCQKIMHYSTLTASNTTQSIPDSRHLDASHHRLKRYCSWRLHNQYHGRSLTSNPPNRFLKFSYGIGSLHVWFPKSQIHQNSHVTSLPTEQDHPCIATGSSVRRVCNTCQTLPRKNRL